MDTEGKTSQVEILKMRYELKDKHAREYEFFKTSYHYQINCRSADEWTVDSFQYAADFREIMSWFPIESREKFFERSKKRLKFKKKMMNDMSNIIDVEWWFATAGFLLKPKMNTTTDGLHIWKREVIRGIETNEQKRELS